MNHVDSTPAAARQRVFLSFQTLFAYRDVWMGLAILAVVYAHFPLYPGGLLNVLKDISYGGVDIFLLASGIGCAYSLNRDPDILRFLRRRASRILPMYFLALLFWFAYCICTSHLTFSEAVGNLFGHGILAGAKHQFNWYLACSWICYLSTPFFLALAKACPSHRHRLLIIGILVFLSLTFSWQFQLVLWSRIPIYFYGVCLTETSTRKEGLTRKEFLLLLAAMALGFAVLGCAFRFYPQGLWNRGLYWYPFILIAPGLCCLLSLLASRLDQARAKFLVTLFRRGSKHTFSLFLSHILVFEVLQYLAKNGYCNIDPITAHTALILSAAGALLLEAFDRLCKRILQRRKA